MLRLVENAVVAFAHRSVSLDLRDVALGIFERRRGELRLLLLLERVAGDLHLLRVVRLLPPVLKSHRLLLLRVRGLPAIF